MKTPSSTYAQIYAVVRKIPPGRVATYGQIAALSGFPGQARLVGYALNALPEGHNIPWQRVINAQGKISLPLDSGWGSVQKQLLEQEGVRFNRQGKVSLPNFQWQP